MWMDSACALLQCGLRRFQKFDAFALPALSLEHMGDGMHGPSILGVAADRLQADLFRALRFSRLFKAEGILAEHIAIGVALAVPRGQNACDGIADIQGMAEVEIGVMGKAQRQGIVG